MLLFSKEDSHSFAVIFLLLIYYFQKHFESFIDIALLFKKVLFNLAINHLCTNIPISEIITSISSLKD